MPVVASRSCRKVKMSPLLKFRRLAKDTYVDVEY